MAARPRREGESYEDYRAALKGEESEIKRRLRGTMKYISCMFNQVPDLEAPAVKHMPPPMKTVRETMPPLRANLKVSRKLRRAARHQ